MSEGMDRRHLLRVLAAAGATVAGGAAAEAAPQKKKETTERHAEAPAPDIASQYVHGLLQAIRSAKKSIDPELDKRLFAATQSYIGAFTDRYYSMSEPETKDALAVIDALETAMKAALPEMLLAGDTRAYQYMYGMYMTYRDAAVQVQQNQADTQQTKYEM